MTRAIVETRRRRQRQQEHNRRHGIVPRTIVKVVPNDSQALDA